MSLSDFFPIIDQGFTARGFRKLMTDTWRIEAIASLARVVQDDPDPDQLASHIAFNVLGSLDCRAVALGVITKEGFLDLIGYFGLSKATTLPYIRMPLWSSLPMTEAARTGELIFIKSYDEFVDRYPNLRESIEHKEAVTVASPIKHRNTVIGSIAFASMQAPQDDFLSNPMTDAALALLSLYLRNFIVKRNSNVEKDYSGVLKSLTPRQIRIIELFRDELTTDQMADRLRFSPSTVKQDIIRLYELFGVNSREQVVALAESAGLLNSGKDS